MPLWASSGVVIASLVVLSAVMTRVLAAMVPHVLIRVAVLFWPASHPRRREIKAEFWIVPASDREAYTAGIVVAGIVDGLGSRLSFLGRSWTIFRVLSELAPAGAWETVKWRGRFNFLGLVIGAADLGITFFLDGPVVLLCAATGLALVTPPASRLVLRLWDGYKALLRRISLGPQHVVIALLIDYKRVAVDEAQTVPKDRRT